MKKWEKKHILLFSILPNSLEHERAILSKHDLTLYHANETDTALNIHKKNNLDLILLECSPNVDFDTESFFDELQDIKPVPVILMWDEEYLENDPEFECYSRYGCLIKNSHEFVLIQGLLMGMKLFETHRETAEKTEKLSLNEELLFNVFETMDEGILVLDNEFRYTYWNKKMETISECTREQVLGRKPKEIFPFLRPEILKALETAMSGTHVSNVEWQFELPNGHTGWTKESFFPLKNSENEIVGLVGVVLDITDQKEAEEKLQASKSRFKALVDSSINSIMVHNGKQFLYVNPAAINMFGGEVSSDIVGKSITDLIHPDSIKSVRNRIQRVKEDEYIPFEEERLLRLDGSTFYAEVTGIPIEYNGKSAIQVIAQDITQQKLIQLELSKLATSFSATSGQELFDNVCTNLCDTLDMDFAFIGEYVPNNKSIQLISAFEGEKRLDNFEYDLAHTPCEEVMDTGICTYPKNVQQLFPDDKQLQDDGIEAYIGMPLFSRLGQRVGILVLLKKTPIKDVDRARALLQIYSERVSAEMERLQSERLISDMDKQLSSISTNISEGIYRSSHEGGLIYANQAFATMFGYDSPEEILKIKSVDLYADPNNRATFIKKTKEHIQIKDSEVEFKRKDGSTFWALLNTSIVHDEDGNPKFFDGAIHDITARKLYEDRLEESLKEKEVLLSEIHHRVKNNLAVISGLIDLQRFSFHDEVLDRLLLSTQNRILSIAKVHELLYRSENFADIKIQTLVEQLCQGISKSFNSARLSIDFEIDAEQIFLNAKQAVPFGLLLNELINNSYKHAFDDMTEGNIIVRIIPTDTGLHLYYKDNGKGLPSSFDTDQMPQDSLGFSLIHNLADQLSAEDISMTNDQGFCFQMTFFKPDSPQQGSVLGKSFSSDLKRLYTG